MPRNSDLREAAAAIPPPSRRCRGTAGTPPAAVGIAERFWKRPSDRCRPQLRPLGPSREPEAYESIAIGGPPRRAPGSHGRTVERPGTSLEPPGTFRIVPVAGMRGWMDRAEGGGWRYRPDAGGRAAPDRVIRTAGAASCEIKERASKRLPGDILGARDDAGQPFPPFRTRSFQPKGRENRDDHPSRPFDSRARSRSVPIGDVRSASVSAEGRGRPHGEGVADDVGIGPGAQRIEAGRSERPSGIYLVCWYPTVAPIAWSGAATTSPSRGR
jgi:hypothetical protein